MSYIGTEPKDIRSFGRTKFDYTATQGQTAFTGADDDGKVLAFTTGQINVYVNGILMDDSDFTTTGTGTVTLASAANLNDVVNVVSFESNIPDNDYVPASGGTFTGNVTNSGNVTVGGTLGVTGVTTLSGNSTVGGTLGVTGKITSTAGITFGSDTAAANVLHDYEEGTWTPTLGGNASYDIQYGTYVKVGDLVFIRFAIRPTSLGTGSASRISGLPFSATTELQGLDFAYYDGAATSHYSIYAYIENSYIDLAMKTSSINGISNSTTFFQNNARLYASGTYKTT